MLGIARLGDPISCGDFVGEGSNNVFINDMPAARQGDMTTGHAPFPPTPIIDKCSTTVFINGRPAVLLGSIIQTHCVGPSCHNGSVVQVSGDSSGT